MLIVFSNNITCCEVIPWPYNIKKITSWSVQFRSRRSSAQFVQLERCAMVCVPILPCTHMPGWQQDTHSWSWMVPVYVPPHKLSISSANPNLKSFPLCLPSKSFGLMCIQLACYHGVKVLTTSHTPQKHTFLEQLRPSVGMCTLAFGCLQVSVRVSQKPSISSVM